MSALGLAAVAALVAAGLVAVVLAGPAPTGPAAGAADRRRAGPAEGRAAGGAEATPERGASRHPVRMRPRSRSDRATAVGDPVATSGAPVSGGVAPGEVERGVSRPGRARRRRTALVRRPWTARPRSTREARPDGAGSGDTPWSRAQRMAGVAEPAHPTMNGAAPAGSNAPAEPAGSAPGAGVDPDAAAGTPVGSTVIESPRAVGVGPARATARAADRIPPDGCRRVGCRRGRMPPGRMSAARDASASGSTGRICGAGFCRVRFCPACRTEPGADDPAGAPTADQSDTGRDRDAPGRSASSPAPGRCGRPRATLAGSDPQPVVADSDLAVLASLGLVDPTAEPDPVLAVVRCGCQWRPRRTGERA